MTAGRRFLAVYAVIAVLLLYQMVSALVAEVRPLSAGPQLAVTVGALVLLGLVVVVIPAGTGGLRSQPASLPSMCATTCVALNLNDTMCATSCRSHTLNLI